MSSFAGHAAAKVRLPSPRECAQIGPVSTSATSRYNISYGFNGVLVLAKNGEDVSAE